MALDDGDVEEAGQTCYRQTTLELIALHNFPLEANSHEFVEHFPHPRLAKTGADPQRPVMVSLFANADC